MHSLLNGNCDYFIKGANRQGSGLPRQKKYVFCNCFEIWLSFFVSSFFKDLFFIIFFIGKADIQRGETERKIFRPMIHSPSEPQRLMLCRSEARSLFKVSHEGAGSPSFGLSLTAFPGHKQGAGWEEGPPGLEPAPIWDPGACKVKTLTTAP